MGYQPKVLCKNCVHFIDLSHAANADSKKDDDWKVCSRSRKGDFVSLVTGKLHTRGSLCKDERRDRFFTTTCGSKGRFYESKQQTPPNQGSGVSFAWCEPPMTGGEKAIVDAIRNDMDVRRALRGDGDL